MFHESGSGSSNNFHQNQKGGWLRLPAPTPTKRTELGGTVIDGFKVIKQGVEAIWSSVAEPELPILIGAEARSGTASRMGGYGSDQN